ncbi:MAG: Smr/MutS family protein [Dehalococcoidales bacterium]|nr:Smr/MutS family protein [Dehalococcoidales bacterium]
MTNSREEEYYSEPPAPDELRLRYQTIDEALPKVASFLHDAYVAGFPQIKIIHGKGTGALREQVRRELGRHLLVKSFRPGENWEGGEGVTIVELSEK